MESKTNLPPSHPGHVCCTWGTHSCNIPNLNTDPHCLTQDMSAMHMGLTHFLFQDICCVCGTHPLSHSGHVCYACGACSCNIPNHTSNSLQDEAAVPIFHGRNQKWGLQGFGNWPKVTQRVNEKLDVTPVLEGSGTESLLLLVLAIP